MRMVEWDGGNEWERGIAGNGRGRVERKTERERERVSERMNLNRREEYGR